MKPEELVSTLLSVKPEELVDVFPLSILSEAEAHIIPSRVAAIPHEADRPPELITRLNAHRRCQVEGDLLPVRRRAARRGAERDADAPLGGEDGVEVYDEAPDVPRRRALHAEGRVEVELAAGDGAAVERLEEGRRG